ncbi:MAG: FAD:protein FMN transferase [Oscillospiraceae bacterium]|nr:FAD:protein FMN transferase [Oscillospiraceae bacterium]
MKKWLTVFCALLLLTGCAREEKTTQEFFAMDTVISLTVWESDAAEEMRLAADILRDLEGRLSVTREDSEVAQLNAAGEAELSDETAALLARALELERQTGGACSPALYTLTSLWGFTAEEPGVPAAEDIEAALASIAAGGVSLEGNRAALEGTALDFGAFAKGYAAQRIAEELGDMPAVLSLGGNVQTVGQKPDGTPWQIGIKDPRDQTRNVGVLSLGEAAVVTSGGYQRYFEEDGVRYIHILDPQTGYPVDNDLASVTIVSADGLLADAYSTALYVMGFDAAVDFWREQSGFEAVFVLEDGAVFATEGLAECFECNKFTVVNR